MRSSTKIVGLLIIIIIIKVVLSTVVPTLSAYSDEYYYSQMARSMWMHHEVSIHGEQVSFYPPLYPMLLSLAYAFKDMSAIYLVMKMLNAIVSSLVIIPIFLLARKLMSERSALGAAAISAMLPATFSFTPYLLAENLLIVLVAFAVYFLYESFTEKTLGRSLLAGICIGLAILTKWSALILLVVPLLLWLWEFFRKKSHHAVVLWIYVGAAVVVLPWLIRNGILFGFSLQKILGTNVVNDITAVVRVNSFIPSLIAWVVLYAGYLLLASGIFFGVLAWSAVKEFRTHDTSKGLFARLMLIMMLLFILVAANHATGNIIYDSPFSFLTDRPVGRYLEMILPLVIVLGFMVFEQRRSIVTRSMIIGSAVLAAVSSLLLFAPLFPSNNGSLAWLGIFGTYLKSWFDASGFSWGVVLVAAVFLFLAAVSMAWLKRVKIPVLGMLLVSFFILSSVASIAVTAYQARQWESSKMISAVRTFPEVVQGDGIVLFDQNSCGDKIARDAEVLCEGEYATVMGFWLNNDLRIGDPEKYKEYGNVRYIVSTRELPFAGIVKYRGIVLYKTYL